MKIEFTEQERQVIEEAFQKYMHTLEVIAKLKGLGNKPIQIVDDRSGFIVPDQDAAPLKTVSQVA